MKYFETSAKDNKGVEEAFLEIAKLAASQEKDEEMYYSFG